MLWKQKKKQRFARYPQGYLVIMEVTSDYEMDATEQDCDLSRFDNLEGTVDCADANLTGSVVTRKRVAPISLYI